MGTLRHPTPDDAAAIHDLVVADGVLDPNSVYCYLLICCDFTATSLVATDDAGLAGFVAGYRPPARPTTLFVWQIGVASRARRQGLGQFLLHRLLAAPGCAAVEFVEATITPSNSGSRRLFTRFAESIGAGWQEGPRFSAALFRDGDRSRPRHEEERYFRIGPLATGRAVDESFSRGGRTDGYL